MGEGTLTSQVLDALGRSTAQMAGGAALIDDVGLVVDIHGDRPMQPNSTQKVFSVGSALLALGPQWCWRTEVRRSAPLSRDGTLRGNLALAGGGDPYFTSNDLSALAQQVAASGIRIVQGDLIGDVSRHTDTLPPEGWAPYYVPTWCSPMSPLVLDGNRWRRDAAFLADPAQAIVARFRAALADVGVTVVGVDRTSRQPTDGQVVAAVHSKPLEEIARSILKKSDTFAAELLLKELGASKGEPTTAGGLSMIQRWRSRMGVGPAVVYDGSGLSPISKDTPLQQLHWLKQLDRTPGGRILRASMPTAAVDGTLRNRFRESAAAGSVLAKTGTRVRHGSLNLAGYATTSSGRSVWFSFMLTGARCQATARAALDAAVTSIVTAA